jgi:hypothetical protein
VVDLVDDLPACIRDGDELEAAVLAATATFHQALVLQALDQRAGGGLTRGGVGTSKYTA